MFFIPDGMRGPEKKRLETEARMVCAGCPVRTACLDWALRVPEKYGIYGGMDEDQRRAYRRNWQRHEHKQRKAG